MVVCAGESIPLTFPCKSHGKSWLLVCMALIDNKTKVMDNMYSIEEPSQRLC